MIADNQDNDYDTAIRMGMNAIEDINRMIDDIEDTDWYHISDGKLVHGANPDDHIALYKHPDIEAICDKYFEIYQYDPYEDDDYYFDAMYDEDCDGVIDE